MKKCFVAGRAKEDGIQGRPQKSKKETGDNRDAFQNLLLISPWGECATAAQGHALCSTTVS